MFKKHDIKCFDLSKKKMFMKLLNLIFGRSLVSGSSITKISDYIKCLSLNN